MSGDPNIPGGNLSLEGDSFVVLVNDRGQYSLWPAGQPVPEGWSTANPPDTKAAAIIFIESQWTDLGPTGQD